MNKRLRPINLQLTKYLPLPAIASITHRISGVILFVGLGFLLYLLDESLRSAQGLEQARASLAQPIPKLLIFFVLATLIYHFVAGIRHLLLDFEIGDSLEGARLASKVTFGVSIAMILLTGVWLW